MSGSGTITGGTVRGDLQFDLNASDRLDFTGDLELDGARLVLSGTPGEPVYVLSDYATLSGQFGTVSGLPNGYVLDHAYEGNQIALVATSLSPYTIWVEAISGLSGAEAAFDADPNNDGVANGIAFFLGAENATINARPLVPVVSTTAGTTSFTFTRAPEAVGYTFAVRYSTDLSSWTSAADGIDGVALEISGSQITATLPAALSVDGELYLALQVEVN